MTYEQAILYNEWAGKQKYRIPEEIRVSFIMAANACLFDHQAWEMFLSHTIWDGKEIKRILH